MVKRNNNQLPQNLPQLQNLIKRDPASYKDEFIQQERHYKSLLKVFELSPAEHSKSLDELVMFMAQVAHCYPDVLVNFAQELIDILQKHSTVLHPEMRMCFCKALILLRNKNLLAPTDLLSLFFQLLRAQDKNLRAFLESHIINDIKNINAKHKNMKLNNTLQNFMFNMLKDNNTKAVKMSLSIMMELYKKNVWHDAKTVNVIATACFSKITKVMVAALKFFLSSDEPEKESDDSDSDDEVTPKDVMMANRFNKKTRKREKQLKKVKQLAVKKKKKNKAPNFNFSALHLLHDPQGMAEKLFRQLEKTHERFEVKVLTLDVISRLIGLHQLIILNFYPFIQRYLQPHQRDVTKLLLFVAQASHEYVPPDALEPVLRTLVNNFVTERNSSDAMAIGLNAIRELCSRCPLAMNEDLLRDLVQYKSYRDRSVAMAARSLMHLFRTSLPEMLHKKDRGRPTEVTIELKAKKFGEIDSKDYVPGAEVLLEEAANVPLKDSSDENDSDSDWIDVSHSEDEDNTKSVGDKSVDGTGEEEEDELDDEEGSEDDEEDEDEDEEEESEVPDDEEKNNPAPKKPRLSKAEKKSVAEQLAEKKELAKAVSSTKFLTDEDFKRIEAMQIAKEVTGLKRGVKRSAVEMESPRGELLTLGDIENIYKKKKTSKEERILSVRRGQEGREPFGYKVGRVNPHASTTNREKKKTKNFMMVRHKARSKVKRSFKDKQIALRNYLIKQKKMK
ncbi:protein SDA1 homolog [Halyomorpha halys]|uniref:protein SDA1 homolog n=1 Tax=Halyomorpha halys TaxID=286706 RepID=UPI0006D4F602|nr:protein SDA1 homolog [Halyomorpha halys]XP_024216221.1 protein SDA1 homolog [Halyomorpha halys]XP_024216226.1 protein SDA1 homolog [Halyomorpha halys]